MKRVAAAILLLVILLCGCTPEIRLEPTTNLIRTGTVMDCAMASPSGSHKIWDKSYPYLSIEFEDGTAVCLWNKLNIDIPEQIGIGDTVEVIYALESGTDHWILTNIKEVN